MARWFASEREQGLNFQVDDNPSFLALDQDHGVPRSHTYDVSSGNSSGWSDMTQSAVFGCDAAGNVTFQSDGAASVVEAYDGFQTPDFRHRHR